MTIPFLLWTLIVSVSSLGTLAYQFEWRKVVNIQMNLDRSVGNTALELQDLMNRIEQINGIMIKTRTAMAAQQVLGLPFAPAGRVALEAQAKIQDGLLLAWKITHPDTTLSILSWKRPLPDPIGPQPLQWAGGPDIPIRKIQFPRKAFARVIKGGLNAKKIWNAEWTSFY